MRTKENESLSHKTAMCEHPQKLEGAQDCWEEQAFTLLSTYTSIHKGSHITIDAMLS